MENGVVGLASGSFNLSVTVRIMDGQDETGAGAEKLEQALKDAMLRYRSRYTRLMYGNSGEHLEY